MDKATIQNLCAERKVKWTTHSLTRMQERDISRRGVLAAIENGEIIEDYLDDYPHPSCLIFGTTEDSQNIHVVVGYDGMNLIVITAYRPDTDTFEANLKTRKEK